MGETTGSGDAFPWPLVTVDVVIFTLGADRLRLLLMRRGDAPFAGDWALPGGYVRPQEDDDLDAAARRILADKTGVATPYVEQLQGFGDRWRDPRGWTATFAYVALIPGDGIVLRQGTNATAVSWHPADMLPALAFDHARIVATALARLRSKVTYSSLPVHLLPPKFTLPDLQRVYEQILGRPLDKSAFRKRIAEADFIEPVAGERRAASNRPAQIYRLKPGLPTTFFDRMI